MSTLPVHHDNIYIRVVFFTSGNKLGKLCASVIVHCTNPGQCYRGTVGRMVRYYFGRMSKFAKGSKSFFGQN